MTIFVQILPNGKMEVCADSGNVVIQISKFVITEDGSTMLLYNNQGRFGKIDITNCDIRVGG